MMKRKSAGRRQNKIMKVLYLVLGFVAIGFFPALFLPNQYGPRVAMVLAAGLVIPVGMRSASLLKGGLAGLGLGLLAGHATFMGIMQKGYDQGYQLPPDPALRMAIISTVSTAVLCGGVAMFFAHLAQKRMRRIEDEWR